jgi:anti-anti-sigma factor
LKNMVGMHAQTVGEGILRMKVDGPLFFMAAQRLQDFPQQEGLNTLLLDLEGVPFMDASALKAIAALKENTRMQGIDLRLENLQSQPHRMLKQNGFELA